MNLRSKLLLLAAVSLLLPLSGWLLLRELESFLRQGQQQALQASAETIARSAVADMDPGAVQQPVLYAMPMPDLNADGHADDWTGNHSGLSFSSADGVVAVTVFAGETDGQLALRFEVRDSTPVRLNLNPAQRDAGLDGIELSCHGQRGLYQFIVASAATGPLNLVTSGSGREQISGYWLDTAEGYRIELLIPMTLGSQGISFRLVDVEDPVVRIIAREINSPPLLHLLRRNGVLDQRLNALVAPQQNALIVNQEAYVIAAAAARPVAATGDQAAWLERVFHRLLMLDRSPASGGFPSAQARIDDPLIQQALGGKGSGEWRHLPATSELLNRVAVPVMAQNRPVGAVMLESSSDSLLLLTNRAIVRVVGISLLTTLLLALALYLFASRLSGRVRRLNQAVTEASTDPATALADLPMQQDRDELGELARSHERLLQAVRDYNAYLKTLAGKLSHELKTPLVIVRSSLENLEREGVSQPAEAYLQRAQEGTERLSEILRAMSDAGRLEQAIEGMEMEAFDLAGLLRQTGAAYRQIYPRRQIEIEIDAEPLVITGAAELIVQALDKLVNNAVSFTRPHDRICLGLRTEQGGALLQVSNTGSSLPDTMQDQLFESLVSVRRKKGREPHLGLGLYLVKLIAEAHGGKAEAGNLADGNGVVFTIRLKSDAIINSIL